MRTPWKGVPAFFVLFAASASAQNRLHHYDGTTEFTSRGSMGADPKTLLQRIPGDQACGSAEIVQSVCLIQDQNTATPESYQFQVRANDPANPGTPDMSSAGLIGSGPVIPVTFPGGPIAALVVTITLTPPVPTPPGPPGVPAGDFYVGLDFPAAPFWASDGISIHMSGGPSPTNPGEQQSPSAVGYTGVPGQAGLAWEMNNNPFTPSGPNTLPTLPNRAWNMSTGLTSNVTQGFAHNVLAFIGFANSPNFGYAGIWPHMLRIPGPDGFGFRVRATAPLGTPTVLLVGYPPLFPAPRSFAGVGGALCHVPIPEVTIALGCVGTEAAPGQPAGTTQAMFGPFPGNPTFLGGTIHAQGLTLGPGGLALASMCTMSFE